MAVLATTQLLRVRVIIELRMAFVIVDVAGRIRSYRHRIVGTGIVTVQPRRIETTAPRKSPAFGPARRLFPFFFGRQTPAHAGQTGQPNCVGGGFRARHKDDRMTYTLVRYLTARPDVPAGALPRMIEPVAAPCRDVDIQRGVVRRGDECRVLRVRDRRCGDTVCR